MGPAREHPGLGSENRTSRGCQSLSSSTVCCSPLLSLEGLRMACLEEVCLQVALFDMATAITAKWWRGGHGIFLPVVFPDWWNKEFVDSMVKVGGCILGGNVHWGTNWGPLGSFRVVSRELFRPFQGLVRYQNADKYTFIYNQWCSTTTQSFVCFPGKRRLSGWHKQATHG